MLEFGLLGEVRVLAGGEPVDIGHARQRSVLAALVVDANSPVSADQLLDRVWGERPPATARGTLSTYLSRLRSALPAGAASISRRAGGYVLTTAPETIDLVRFHDLLDQARGSSDAAAGRLFGQALGLWRGQPLRDLESPWALGVRHQLEREHHAALLDAADVDLRRGRHAEVAAALHDLAAEHPLDERLAAQLILALYRSGRSADALSHYDRFRTRLADELGADPAPPLRELHAAILTSDAAVLAPDQPAVRPRQLPPPPPTFTGRAREVAALTERLGASATVVISAIGGSGGIGKTWLALHWAHQHADRFPDGQLYVNLRGFDPSSTPVPPSAALRGFLNALGVTDAELPADTEARAALFRSVVAERRMLVLLDNAADSAQVTPLLPGGSTCATVITTRHPLAGLVTTHGAHPVGLDVLTDPEAHDLLRRRLGPARLAAEPAAVAALVRHCGGLPLALSIVAAHAAITPSLPLAVLAADLRHETTALNVLDTGDTDLNLRAVFAVSYRALSPEAARLAALIGLAPGPDISTEAASALAPAALLRELVDAHLLIESAPGRYRMHDLVRLDAVERGQALPQVERDTTLRDLVRHYVTNAHSRDRVLDPHRPPIDLTSPEVDADNATVIEWFETEHACLMATQLAAADRGLHADVVNLAWSVTSFHRRRGHPHEATTIWRTAVESAEKLGDNTLLAMAHRYLGESYTNSSENDLARHHLDRALALLEEDAPDLFVIHRTLAMIHDAAGSPHNALHHATEALRMAEHADNPTWLADAHNTVGWYHFRLDHLDEARAHCEEALTRARLIGDQDTEGTSQDSLACIASRAGDHPLAMAYFDQALTMWRRRGFTYEEADILERIGDAHLDAGQAEQARERWREALALYREQRRRTDVHRVERRLTEAADRRQ